MVIGDMPDEIKMEVAVQKGGSTDSEEEKTEEQGGTELQLKNNDEIGGTITKEENLTEVEDWASTEESYAIENKSDKGKVPKLCGISADKIYYSYTVSDHEKDDMTLIYCMYDRNSKATEKLYEHKIRDIVFPAICYNDHMYILDVDMPNYQIWDVSAGGANLFAEGKQMVQSLKRMTPKRNT